MAINERLIDTKVEAAGNGGAGNAGEEGLILHLDANDVDSYDGDGDVWYDIKDHEYTPDTNVSEHFNTVLYTGNNSTNSITGVGFQPDLVWIKDRNQSEHHYLIDSVRGKNGSTVFENLYSSLPNAQANDNAVTSLDADGFTLQASGNGNVSGESNVAWCFKAGGAPTATNTGGQTPTSGSKMVDGTAVTDNYPTVDIYPTKQSVNTKLGFSVTEYTFSSPSTSQTVAHGLSSAPEMIITKCTTATGNWYTYHKDVGTGKYLQLDSSAQATTYANGFSTVDATSWQQYFRSDAQSHIAYCFASKRGVSKVGSYRGIDSTDVKVYTGFEPAWLMIKKTTSDGGWVIWDNKRDTSDPRNKWLRPHLSSQEVSYPGIYDVYFDVDGFTVDGYSGGNDTTNNTGDTYIYYAVAKNTKETSLIPDRASFTEGSVTAGAELELDANDYSGSGNWLDSSGNSNDGTISGAVYVNDGSSDYFNFDGVDDYVQITPIPSTLQNDAIITGEAWIYPKAATSNSIISFRGSGSTSIKFFLAANSSGQLYLVSASTSSFLVFGTTASNVVPVNKWTHVAATINYTTKDYYIYANGELVSSGNQSNIRGRNTFSATDLLVGTNLIGVQHSNLKIGQARIYSSALTPTQIKSNYDATKIYALPSLELHLDADSFPQFDEIGYLNEPSTWTDSSGNGNNSTINGAVFDSELGNWLDFDGVNDEVNWSTFPTAFQSLTAITMELWVKFDTVSGTQYPIWLGRAAYGKSVNIGLVGGKIQTWVGTQGFPSLFTPVANKWYHLAVTISGTQQTVYVDGEDYTNNSNTQGLTMDSNGANVFLLGDYSGGTADFNGQIGQVRIYSSTLTQDQIRQNYNFTKNNYPNGNDGTITNATWNPSGYFNFDGLNDEVVIPMSFSGGGSIAMWVNITDINANNAIATKYTTGTDNRSFAWYIYNGGAVFSIYYNSSGNGNSVEFDMQDYFTSNQWHHITHTFDVSSRPTIYVDGAAVSELSQYNSPSQNVVYSRPSVPVVLGQFDGSTNDTYDFDGKISKVKLYDRVLTQEEITALYNEGE